MIGRRGPPTAITNSISMARPRFANADAGDQRPSSPGRGIPADSSPTSRAEHRVPDVLGNVDEGR